MIQRPRFIFEQEEEQRSEQIVQKGAKPNRLITEVHFQNQIEVDERKILKNSVGESKKNADTNNIDNVRRNNPELGLGSYRSTSHIVDPSSKISEMQALKYKQPETHMILLTTTPGAKLPEGSNINTSTQQYEDKINNHLQDPKAMKPNLFFREDNQSPIPQDDQRFTLAPPPQYAPTQFDPYKYVGLNKRKSNNKSYQIMLESDNKKKKKAPKAKEVQTTNQSSFNNSSQIVLDNSEIKENEKHEQPVDQVIQEEAPDVALQYPPQNTIVSYNFQIQKIFGVNYFYPDFKILSLDNQVLISAKKEALHINSVYNIYSGNIKNPKKIGILRGNFGGTEFNLYHCNENSEELIATIAQKVEFTCSSTFRKVEVFVKNPQSNKCFTEETTDGKNLKEMFQKGNKTDIIRIITKQPVWREDLQVYVMNFKGKSRMSSTKNIVLTKNESKQNTLLFCKQGCNKFYLQISHPLNLLASMGILLTSFDFKLLCQ